MTAIAAYQTTASAGAVTSIAVTPLASGGVALAGGEMIIVSVEYTTTSSSVTAMTISGAARWTSIFADFTTVDSGGEYHYLQTWVGTGADTANGTAVTVSNATAPTAGWTVSALVLSPSPEFPTASHTNADSGSGLTGTSFAGSTVNMGVNQLTYFAAHAGASPVATASPSGIWTIPAPIASPSPGVGFLVTAWAITTTAAAPTASLSYTQTSGTYAWQQVAFQTPVAVNGGNQPAAAISVVNVHSKVVSSPVPYSPPPSAPSTPAPTTGQLFPT